jgi:hypothetical protein
MSPKDILMKYNYLWEREHHDEYVEDNEVGNYQSYFVIFDL